MLLSRRTKTKASIILPTYNEAGNIVELVNTILSHRPEGWEFEIIVMDDDSSDGTAEIAEKAFRNHPAVSVILRTQEKGLAKSLRAGAERASGDWIIFMDSDFTHHPADLPKMLHLAQAFDIVMGSRFCAGGGMDDRWHYCMSLIYNWFIRLTLRTQIQDNLGGFIVIRREALRRLPYDHIFFGYGEYCFRLLHYAQKLEMTILEMPAHYHTRRSGKSKSNFARLLLNYTWSLVRLKIALACDPKISSRNLSCQ